MNKGYQDLLMKRYFICLYLIRYYIYVQYMNRLVSASDDDSTVTFKYDVLSRVSEENQQGKLVKYEYDNINNLTKITYPSGRVIERTFDAIRRLKGIIV